APQHVERRHHGEGHAADLLIRSAREILVNRHFASGDAELRIDEIHDVLSRHRHMSNLYVPRVGRGSESAVPASAPGPVPVRGQGRAAAQARRRKLSKTAIASGPKSSHGLLDASVPKRANNGTA